MKPGDTVSFKWNGRFLHGAKLVGIYEFHDARKVEKSDLEYIVEAKDVMTEEEMERQRQLEADKQNQAEYGDIIAAWNKGLRTNADIAKATNTPIMGICSRIRAAKRRGLLK